MATYKFSRFLAGAVRVGGLLALVVAIFLVAAGNSVVAGYEGVVIVLGAIGVVPSLGRAVGARARSIRAGRIGPPGVRLAGV